MVHVDDLLMVAKISWIKQICVPMLQKEFQITHEIASECGDSFKFLKREHVITEHGVVVCPSANCGPKLCELHGVATTKAAKTPCVKELWNTDTSKLLDASRSVQSTGQQLD